MDKLKQLYEALLDRCFSADVTEEALMVLDIGSVRRAMGIPEPDAGLIVNLSDGNKRSFDGSVAEDIANDVCAWLDLCATTFTGQRDNLFGWLDGMRRGAIRAGKIKLAFRGDLHHIPVGKNDTMSYVCEQIRAIIAKMFAATKAKDPPKAPSTPQVAPAPAMYFPHSTSGVWSSGRIPDDRWVDGDVLGIKGDAPAVLCRGRITLETSDGHIALIDVDPCHTFEEVGRCVKAAFRLEVERLTTSNKDVLFGAMSSMSKDVCALRNGRFWLRTSGAVETSFNVNVLDSLSTVEDRISQALNRIAGVLTPTPHPEAPPVAPVPVASLGVVYPKVESSPRIDTCAIPVGTRLTPSTYAVGLFATGTSIVTVAPFLGRTGDALLCRTVDGSPWASDVVTWTINEPPAGCYPTASRAAPRA